MSEKFREGDKVRYAPTYGRLESIPLEIMDLDVVRDTDEDGMVTVMATYVTSIQKGDLALKKVTR